VSEAASQIAKPAPSGSGGFFNSVRAFLFAPVDIASLVAYRIGFGALMAWEAWRYVSNGWVRDEWTGKVFYFTFLGFGWVKPWPGDGMITHWIVIGVLAFLIMIGCFYRLAIILFFLGFCQIFLVEMANYLNHFYLICLFAFLMIFVPMHKSLSIDAWWRPKLRASTVPAWTLWLLRGQMAVAYFYAGVAKLNWDWLRGEPLRHWLADSKDGYPFVGHLLVEEWAVYLFSYGALIYDLAVAPLLMWKRTRPYIFAVSLFFHISNKLLFSIGVFPYFSIAATLLFFDPEWPKQFWAWSQRTGRKILAWFVKASDTPAGGGTSGSPARAAPAVAVATTVVAPVALGPVTPRQRAVLWFVGTYFAIQVLVPLRHWLYPGNVSWTEEGHNFAWHMKLRDKEGTGYFMVSSKKGNLEMRVDPRDYLDKRQNRKMALRPDMIHQFAIYLAEEYRKQGYDDVEVRGVFRISLNSRKKQHMVDPTVNLAAEPRNLWHKRWITQLVEPLRLPDKSKKTGAERSSSGTGPVDEPGGEEPVRERVVPQRGRDLPP